MTRAGTTHDVTLSTLGGTPLGFMLYRQNGRRGYSIADAPTIGPAIPSVGEATEAQFPSEIQMTFSQSDWRGGIGGLLAQEDPLRLATAVKIDASIRGKLRNARELTATTVDTNPDVFKATGFALVGTEVHCFIGRDVYSWDYTAKSWVIGTEPVNAANIYRNGVEFAARTFVPSWVAATDLPQRYLYKADADAIGTWTRIGAGAGTQIIGAKYFAIGKNSAGADIMWGAFVLRADATTANNVIVSTTDPTTIATWSGETTIGDTAAPITGLVADGDNLLILKTDGIWAYYSDGTQENLTPDFEGMAHPDNFRGAFNWNGHVLLPLGAGGLMELVGGKLYDISMSLYAPEDGTLDGRVVAITGDPQALFILIQDTATLTYHLLMAKWLDIGGGQDYRWHHMASVTYTTGTVEAHSALLAEGVPSGSTVHHRVWVGIESSGSNVLPYFLPQENDAEDGFTNDTDSVAQFTRYDAGRSKVNKTFAAVDFETANLGAGGRQYAAEYRIDAGSWLTTLTDALGNADGIVDASPNQTLTFPAGTTGKVLELRVKPALTTVGTTSPELLSFRVTCTLRSPATKLLPLSLHLGDGVRQLNGAFGGRPKKDLEQLETWDAQAAEVTVVDSRGTSRDCVFVSGKMKVQELANEANRRPEYRVDLLLAAV